MRSRSVPRVFDFGRSSPDGGTHHFKLQWGAVEAPLYWEYALVTRTAAPDQGPSNPKFRAAIEAWTRLPLCAWRIARTAYREEYPVTAASARVRRSAAVACAAARVRACPRRARRACSWSWTPKRSSTGDAPFAAREHERDRDAAHRPGPGDLRSLRHQADVRDRLSGRLASRTDISRCGDLAGRPV